MMLEKIDGSVTYQVYICAFFIYISNIDILRKLIGALRENIE